MGKLIATVLLVVALLILWRMMFSGYRGRALRQKMLPRPLGARNWEALTGAVEGIYVSTTDAENTLDRIAAHGLGTRSAVAVGFVDGGVGFLRQGARSFVVPAEAIVGIGFGPGMVGKWMGRGDGLIVLRWKIGDRVVDTGVKARHPKEGARFAEAVEELVRSRKTQRPEGEK